MKFFASATALPLVVLVAAAGAGCKSRPPGVPFADRFDRAELGDAWLNTGARYRLQNGELVIDHARNHPLWLRSPIPADAVIEFDTRSMSPDGDIKIELWGDGHSYAKTLSYTATSYVFIFGGWHNQISAIARLNEHGTDRRERADVRVQPGTTYHFRISKKGGHIDWQIDGQPFLAFDDPDPLDGADHAYLGINDWDAELHFDNLSVSPQ